MPALHRQSKLQFERMSEKSRVCRFAARRDLRTRPNYVLGMHSPVSAARRFLCRPNRPMAQWPNGLVQPHASIPVLYVCLVAAGRSRLGTEGEHVNPCVSRGGGGDAAEHADVRREP